MNRYTRILVTGSLSFDYILDFPGRFADRIMPEKIHSLSLSFLTDSLSKRFGGTAGNIAYSLALLGTKVKILSAAGNDFSTYREFLEKHGVDVSGIVISKHDTGMYFVITDKNGSQIGTFYTGASRDAHHLSIKDSYQTGDFLMLSPTDPTAMVSYADECRREGIPYAYDPAFQIESLKAVNLRYAIEGAQILFGNDYEIALIEKVMSVSHEELLMTVPVIVTTLGSKGSVIETPKQAIHIDPARVSRAVDPTGAGDAYRGGFLSGFIRSLPLETCGLLGSVAAAYSVEHYGTMIHTYTLPEFAGRFQNEFGLNFPYETNRS
jgi:adenosine kinase